MSAEQKFSSFPQQAPESLEELHDFVTAELLEVNAERIERLFNHEVTSCELQLVSDSFTEGAAGHSRVIEPMEARRLAGDILDNIKFMLYIADEQEPSTHAEDDQAVTEGWQFTHEGSTFQLDTLEYKEPAEGSTGLFASISTLKRTT